MRTGTRSSTTPATSPSSTTPSKLSRTTTATTKHRTTLYDALTSRLTTYTSLLAPSSRAPTLHRDVLEHSTLRPLTPAEALFEHHRGAPQRFEEADLYDAVGGLPAGARGEGVLNSGFVDWEGGKVEWQQDDGDGDGDEVGKQRERELKRLPSSELLGAVHAYASDFYGALGMAHHAASARMKRNNNQKKRRGREDGDAVEDTRWDFGSMDETALLAFGVLLEESVRAALGEEGDMVFVEGEAQELEDEAEGGRTGSRSRSRSKSRGILGGRSVDVDGYDSEEVDKQVPAQEKQGRKRVRINDRADSTDEEVEARMDRRRKKRRRMVFEGDEDY